MQRSELERALPSFHIVDNIGARASKIADRFRAASQSPRSNADAPRRSVRREATRDLSETSRVSRVRRFQRTLANKPTVV